jgi:hypothetical protein
MWRQVDVRGISACGGRSYPNNVPENNKFKVKICSNTYLAVPEVNGEINELGILLNQILQCVSFYKIICLFF